MGLLGGPLSAAAASGDGYGPLLPADGNNLRLPRGFRLDGLEISVQGLCPRCRGAA